MSRGIFINYRERDALDSAVLLHQALQERLGEDLVFLDSESIPAGEQYGPELLRRLRGSCAVLAVIGPTWLSSTRGGQRLIDDGRDWVRRELAEAFRVGIRVIPILVEDTHMPSAAELPENIAGLARCQYRRLRKRDKTADLGRILKDLAGLDRGLAIAIGGRPRLNRLLKKLRIIVATGVLVAAVTVGVTVGILHDTPTSPRSAAGTSTKPSNSIPITDPSLWHTGETCPEEDAICFYSNRNFHDLLGWLKPTTCSGTYAIMWPRATESIRNRTPCGIYLLYCPGDCWKEWMIPNSEDGTIEPLHAIDRVRLHSPGT